MPIDPPEGDPEDGEDDGPVTGTPPIALLGGPPLRAAIEPSVLRIALSP